MFGASGENRTLVPSLENLYTNRCTTLANSVNTNNLYQFTMQTRNCQNNSSLRQNLTEFSTEITGVGNRN